MDVYWFAVCGGSIVGAHSSFLVGVVKQVGAFVLVVEAVLGTGVVLVVVETV